MRYGIPGFRTPREVLDAEIQRILDLGVKTRLKCRDRHRRHAGAICARTSTRCSSAWARSPGGRCRRPAATRRTSSPPRVPEGVQRRPAAPRRQARGRHRRRRHVDRRRHGRAPPRPHRARQADRLPGARDRRPPGARRGVGVGEAGRRGDADLGVRRRQDAGEQARDRAGAGRRHRHPRRARAGVRGQGRRTAAPSRCASRAARRSSSARKLEIKIIEGTEEDIPADLIVSAIGQAVDFTGLEEFDNGKGAVTADKNYQVAGKPGMFAGGDVLRPHLLTTAIGHGAIAADGIDRFLRGEEQEKRPKIDVHAFDLQRKMIEKGLTFSETHEPIRGTDSTQRRHPQLRQPLRPLRDPARGAVPRPLRLHAAPASATSSR